MQAAARVMMTDGYSGLSIDSLVNEVGTTRPTFYRRFPNIAHLAFEVIATTFGTGQSVDTGVLYDDLLTLQRSDIAMFSSPLMRNNLPGLLESARTDPTVGNLYEANFIGPRRANVARVIHNAIARGEVGQRELDVEFLCDILIGPVLSRTLLPVQAPLDDRLARHTVHAVITVMTA
jgi:AcrR family transcriptional regulator